jgi:hypothetical protein
MGWPEVPETLSVVNGFSGLIFTIGDGRDRDSGAGGRTSANGAGISTGAVWFFGCTGG